MPSAYSAWRAINCNSYSKLCALSFQKLNALAYYYNIISVLHFYVNLYTYTYCALEENKIKEISLKCIFIAFSFYMLFMSVCGIIFWWRFVHENKEPNENLMKMQSCLTRIKCIPATAARKDLINSEKMQLQIMHYDSRIQSVRRQQLVTRIIPLGALINYP